MYATELKPLTDCNELTF